MTEKILEKLNSLFRLTACGAEEFEKFEMGGMNFTAKGWDAEGLGRISLMEATGGPMRMEALIINPTAADAPLFNLDLIELPGKQMLYMEQYDTLLEAARDEEPFKKVLEGFTDIPDIPSGSNWYDDVRYGCCAVKAAAEGMEERLAQLINEYSDLYLRQLQSAPACDAAAKKVKADAYRDGLLAHGGPATDGFLKAWGQERTRELFEKVLFG